MVLKSISHTLIEFIIEHDVDSVRGLDFQEFVSLHDERSHPFLTSSRVRNELELTKNDHSFRHEKKIVRRKLNQ